jgi:hypothetical protein
MSFTRVMPGPFSLHYLPDFDATERISIRLGFHVHVLNLSEDVGRGLRFAVNARNHEGDLGWSLSGWMGLGACRKRSRRTRLLLSFSPSFSVFVFRG